MGNLAEKTLTLTEIDKAASASFDLILKEVDARFKTSVRTGRRHTKKRADARGGASALFDFIVNAFLRLSRN
ncbi:MAG: hypothetical protein PHO46_04475 [Thermoguttaceae bacterium]|jgi:hypothetical protein|nr:hypothetical protein [Thermoguttaceae bacterium]